MKCSFIIWVCLTIGFSPGAHAEVTAADNAAYARYLLKQFEAVAPKPKGRAAAELTQARVELERDPPALEEAVRWIQKGAEKDDAGAQYLMGYVSEQEMPYEGQVVIRGDLVTAAEWFEKAAAQGIIPAMNKLGEYAAYGKLEKYNIESAARWWEKAANLGSTEAMRELGWLYQEYTPETGTLFSPQYEKALGWYLKAAERGDAKAMYEVARQSHFGWGTRKDEVKSKYWLTRSQQAGFDHAGLVLRGAVGFEHSVGEPVEQMSRPPRRSGKIGGSRPDDLSPNELLGSMNEGNQEARLLYAERYEYGQGVPQDLAEAVVQYAQVCHLIDGFRPRWVSVKACEAMVRIYASGKLTPEVPYANIGIEEPEQLPDPQFRYQLAELYWHGNSAINRDPKKAVFWYLWAARAGSRPAMRRLGEMWRDGVNGRPDLAEAERWFQRAAEKQ